MRKYKYLFLVFLLVLLLPACTVRDTDLTGSVSSPVSASASSFISSAASSAASAAADSPGVEASEAASKTAAGGESSKSASSWVSRAPKESSAAPSSRVASSMTITSSLPPMAAPAKPMPPVTAKMPQASGSAVFSKNGAEIDYSNAAEGYIMVRYSGSAPMKVLVYFNGGSSYYQYNIAGNGAYVTLPLQNGSGAYRVRFMENVSGNSYAELCSTVLNADVSGSGYALYPNQFVDYTRSSAAVAKAKSLCANASSNAQKVEAIYRFITGNIKYDYAKAKSVKAGYLPNVDSTLSSKKGICFDYASLMAAMCRSQGIPTRLVMGTTGAGYHAWNEVYLGGWKRYDSTFAAAGQSAGYYTAEKYY